MNGGMKKYQDLTLHESAEILEQAHSQGKLLICAGAISQPQNEELFTIITTKRHVLHAATMEYLGALAQVFNASDNKVSIVKTWLKVRTKPCLCSTEIKPGKLHRVILFIFHTHFLYYFFFIEKNLSRKTSVL